MSNPYAPPRAPVEEPPPPKSSWGRTAAVVVLGSLMSFPLCWGLAPMLAQTLSGTPDGAMPDTLFLALDLLFSFLASLACCLTAVRLAPGRVVASSFGVGGIGALVYVLLQAGTPASGFPLWYDWFPASLASAWVAAWLGTR